jgi:hypothetical protein
LITEFGWSQVLEAEIADVKRNDTPHIAVLFPVEGAQLPIRVYIFPVEYRDTGNTVIGVVSTLHEAFFPQQVKWLSPVVAHFHNRGGWVVDVLDIPPLTPRIVAVQQHIARQNADAHAMHKGVG